MKQGAVQRLPEPPRRSEESAAWLGYGIRMRKPKSPTRRGSGNEAFSRLFFPLVHVTHEELAFYVKQ